MNKYEKKLGEIINKYSLEVELIKPAGATIQAFNITNVKIKLDKLGIPDTFLRYSEDERGCDALACIQKLVGTLAIHIDKFNNMTFYQYAIYVNQEVYDEKYNNFIKWIDLKDEINEWLQGELAWKTGIMD